MEEELPKDPEATKQDLIDKIAQVGIVGRECRSGAFLPLLGWACGLVGLWGPPGRLWGAGAGERGFKCARGGRRWGRCAAPRPAAARRMVVVSSRPRPALTPALPHLAPPQLNASIDEVAAQLKSKDVEAAPANQN
jgi:hypothetical protein